MDLVIRRSRLQGREGSWDIGIQGDRIAAVADRLKDQGAEELDAAGRLVAPTYVNGHVHLDKCNL
ncbi:MAG: hypothetical protein ACE5MK_11115, partial [Acidobacteriota bacterium]